MLHNINLNVPTSWGKLSQRQLRILFKYLAFGRFSTPQCKFLLALRFSGAKYLGFFDGMPAISIDGQVATIDDNESLAILHALDFIDEPADFPVRIFELNHRKAVHPLMRELSFAQWLAIENFYTGFLQDKDPAKLNEILAILYPAKGVFGKFLKPFKNSKDIDWKHINALYWIQSFKKYLCRRYRELFHQTDSSQNLSKYSVIEAMESQIRALTKGDITKKEAVLEMDVHSALSELDALALEARKFKEATKKK